MNSKSLINYLGVILFSMTLVFATSCSKDDPAPAPEPDYVPSFSATYYSQNVGGVDYLDFYITCTSDDWEMIKVKVTAPGGAGTEEFAGSGAIQLQGEPFTFPQYFLKLGGSWNFTITGNVKSGSHVGESFSTTTSLNISGK